MTETADRELQQWVEAWRSPADTPAGPPEVICRHVQRRSRMLRLWLAGEAAVVVAIAPVLIRTAITGDAPERIAMGLLGAIAAGAVGFSWWNWREAIHASGASTAAFLELSRSRVLRLRRAILAGWLMLTAEVLVFVPWIAYRLYRGDTPPSVGSEVFSWGLLATMTLLGAGFLAGLARWARRERAHLARLQTELVDELSMTDGSRPVPAPPTSPPRSIG